jgi:hypothetical protein
MPRARIPIALSVAALLLGACAVAPPGPDDQSVVARSALAPIVEWATALRDSLRFRLDDGRYQGFHQDDPERLRTSDWITVESDRVQQERRALRN